MTIIIVSHATACPALDGMVSCKMAAERGARYTTLVGGGAGLWRFDGAHHVLAHGKPVPDPVMAGFLAAVAGR